MGLENSQQLLAIENRENKHVIVIAGPGSGKTRIIIKRIEFLNNVLKIDPLNLLIITYTNRAINEISKRIWNYDFEHKYEYKFSGTLHSIAKRLIEEKYIQDFQHIYGKPMKKLFIFDETSVEWFIHVWWSEKFGETDKLTSDNFKEIKTYIFNTKYYSYLDKFEPNSYIFKLYGDEKLSIEVLTEIFTDYQNNLNEKNRLDFFDLLLWFHQLLIRIPEIRQECQEKFKHILVDEFQDINRVQLEIIQEISGKNRNIFCVGDPNQAIYGFQGATPNIFDHFEAKYKSQINIFNLNQNYRSTKNILAFSNLSISNNKNRLKSELWTDNPDGEKINFHSCHNKSQQNKWLIQEIEHLLLNKIKPKDIAILYRADYQANTLKNNLYKSGLHLIDYVKTKIISDERARLLICLIIFSFKKDDLVAKFVFEYFVKIGDISDEAEEKINFYMHKKSWDFWDVFENFQQISGLPEEDFEFLKKLHALIGINENEVIKPFKSKNDLSDFFNKFQKNIVDINDEINWFTARHEIYKLSAELWKNIRVWEDLEHFFMTAFAYVKHYHCYQNDNFLNLSTIHGAKGCEFDYVFLLNLSEEQLPNHYAIRKDKTNFDLQNNSAIDEERRVFYVAITRTRKKLNISHYIQDKRKMGANVELQASRFISEIINSSKNIMNIYKVSKFNKTYIKTLI